MTWNNRTIIALVVGFVVLPSFVLAADSGADRQARTIQTQGNLEPASDPSLPPRWGLVSEREAIGPIDTRPLVEDLVQQKLRKIIENVTYVEVPVGDVIEDLRARSGLNIVVNWRSLEAGGIDQTEPLTMRLHDVSVRKLLRLVLDNVRQGLHAPQIGYVVDENVITIATVEDLAGAAEAEFSPEKAKQTEIKLELIERLQKVCLDPAAVGLIASAGLRNDVSRSRGEIIEDLETLLVKTQTLGLRNAIRLTLRELYKATGNDEKVLEHLRAMLTENDAAIESQAAKAHSEITRLKAEILGLQSELLKTAAQIEDLQAVVAKQSKQMEDLKKELTE